VEALRDHSFWRRNFHPTDPPAILESTKREAGYLEAMDTLRGEFEHLLAWLKKSAPAFSMRYQGHMTWDQTLPGMIGYVAAMLYNQNNVAIEASPITTYLEVKAGYELCEMLGYQPHPTDPTMPQAWGHLTCGGSTANIEAVWAARNLKFYPISIKAALTDDDYPELVAARDLTVTLPSGQSGVKLIDLDSWQILNLSVDEILALVTRITEIIGEDNFAVIDKAIGKYSLQNLGFMEFSRTLLDPDVPLPVIFVSGAKHYSLPKGADILGIGANQMKSIPLDIHGRLDVNLLKEQLDECLANKQAVISVIPVIGTTEEGQVDPLADVLDLRDDVYNPANMTFCVHADAAWGGYFAAMVDSTVPPEPAETSEPAPVLPMSDYVTRQYQNLYRADTITLDPHKTGYVPYPAGALCYRNESMRSLIAFEAPYINTDPDGGDPDFVIGSYGIEGSKPGAAAAGVYLSHAVIPLNLDGYGKILGRSLYNCKMFHAWLLNMNTDESEFEVIPTPEISLIGPFKGYKNQTEVNQKIRESLQGKSHKDILRNDDTSYLELLKELGSDLNIITYAFNFKGGPAWNESLEMANEFNKLIYSRISIQADGRDIYGYNFIASTTDFKKDGYGPAFFNHYKARLLRLSGDVEDPNEDSITVIRSVIMDPWISEDLDGNPFLDTIIAELKAVVEESLVEMKEKYPELFT